MSVGGDGWRIQTPGGRVGGGGTQAADPQMEEKKKLFFLFG